MYRLVKVKFLEEVVVLCTKEHSIEDIFHMAYEGLYEDILNCLPQISKKVKIKKILDEADVPDSYTQDVLPWGVTIGGEELTIGEILNQKTRKIIE